MSTTTSCRRDEAAPMCQPDRTILIDHADKAEACEKQTMSEKQFMRDHSLYSAVSSWLFAISGATNIAILSTVSGKILKGIEEGKPIFKSNDPAIEPIMNNKRYNRLALGITAFGAVCMAVSNWLESKKVVTEWQLGAGKMQRKINGAEREQAMMAYNDQSTDTDTAATPTHPKNWVDSVQPKIPDIESFTHHFRAG